MSEHVADISWSRGSSGFGYEQYSRDHTWRFDGGVELVASASPLFRGNPKAVDPEEALVAAVSSCHMLTFLAIASRKGLIVDSYRDQAVGVMEKNEQGTLAITLVTLRPAIEFSGAAPSLEILEGMHDAAHKACFIANSVNARIEVLLT